MKSYTIQIKIDIALKDELDPFAFIKKELKGFLDANNVEILSVRELKEVEA